MPVRELERQTLEEFSIYDELVNLRVRARATYWGKVVLDQTREMLARYPQLDEATTDQIAQTEARKAEAREAAKISGKARRNHEGLGVGVRALFHDSPHIEEILRTKFVTDPAQLNTPELVEVEAPGDAVYLGLTLPEGMFSERDEGRALRLFAQTVRIGEHGVLHFPDENAPNISIPAYEVKQVSDAGGAFWRPDPIRGW